MDRRVVHLLQDNLYLIKKMFQIFEVGCKCRRGRGWGEGGLRQALHSPPSVLILCFWYAQHSFQNFYFALISMLLSRYHEDVWGGGGGVGRVQPG